MHAQQRQRLAAEAQHGLLVRVVVHAPDETDRVGLVGRRRRLEIFAVDAVRKPARRDAGPIARQRLAARRASVHVHRSNSRASAALGALELGALEPVAEREREAPRLGIDRATSASPCRRSRGSSARRVQRAHVLRGRRAVHEREIEGLCARERADAFRRGAGCRSSPCSKARRSASARACAAIAAPLLIGSMRNRVQCGASPAPSRASALERTSDATLTSCPARAGAGSC